MNIEEKAKAYDDRLEKARKWYDANTNEGYKGIFEDIFPELKELEDERIRKALIKLVKQSGEGYDNIVEGVSIVSAIAWLEKQSTPQVRTGLEWVNTIDDACDKRYLEEYAHGEYCNEQSFKWGFQEGVDWLEKQGEQKSDDKIELKFKVGDWIIFNEHHNSVYQVEKIQSLRYYLRHYTGGSMSVHIDNQLIRHWTIQDTKDGDVLSYRDGQWIFIYKGIVTEDTFKYYALLSEKGITVNDVAFSLLTSCITPATKEQRDTLFAKMEEEGYEWDTEKKELKKIENEIEIPFGTKDSELQEATYYIPKGFHAEIEGNNVIIKKGEQNPAWSEEDEKAINDIMWIIEAYRKNSFNETHIQIADNSENWLKYLKDRIQPKLKQEWSEEDEKIIDDAESWLDMLCGYLYLKNNSSQYIPAVKEVIGKLKSLIPQSQWKPTLQQINALSIVVKHGQTDDLEALKELYEQLKAL